MQRGHRKHKRHFREILAGEPVETKRATGEERVLRPRAQAHRIVKWQCTRRRCSPSLTSSTSTKIAARQFIIAIRGCVIGATTAATQGWVRCARHPRPLDTHHYKCPRPPRPPLHCANYQMGALLRENCLQRADKHKPSRGCMAVGGRLQGLRNALSEHMRSADPGCKRPQRRQQPTGSEKRQDGAN